MEECQQGRITRRGFLQSLLGLSGAAALTTNSGLSKADPQYGNQSSEDSAQGYRETEHIKDYYQSARL